MAEKNTEEQKRKQKERVKKLLGEFDNSNVKTNEVIVINADDGVFVVTAVIGDAVVLFNTSLTEKNEREKIVTVSRSSIIDDLYEVTDKVKV